MFKQLLLAFCLLTSGIIANAQVNEQDGDSIVPPGDTKYETGVFYRIKSLSYRQLELAGFMKGQERDTIVVPQQVLDSIDGFYYSVTNVSPDAFKGQKILKSVTLPTTVTRIGANAFRGCSLSEAVVPGSVYHVEEGAYADNPLKTVIIRAPGEDGSIKLDHSVELFDNCFGSADDPTLKDVYISYTTPPTVADGYKPFPHVAKHNSSAALHLADGADENNYRNAYCWSDFYTPDAITEVNEDILDTDAAPVYYTLQGVNVAADHLTPGIYIVRRGHKVTKTFIH